MFTSWSASTLLIVASTPGVLRCRWVRRCTPVWDASDTAGRFTLRAVLPRVPVMALTAPATGRVRGDIVERLRLREPETFVGSFNRANLFYRVRPKAGALDQVLEFLAERPGDSGIVYFLSLKYAETLADKLTASVIPARAYHVGLGPVDRVANPEAFLPGEVRIVRGNHPLV